jgi:hypothetical protein
MKVADARDTAVRTCYSTPKMFIAPMVDGRSMKNAWIIPLLLVLLVHGVSTFIFWLTV